MVRPFHARHGAPYTRSESLTFMGDVGKCDPRSNSDAAEEVANWELSNFHAVSKPRNSMRSPNAAKSAPTGNLHARIWPPLAA